MKEVVKQAYLNGVKRALENTPGTPESMGFTPHVQGAARNVGHVTAGDPGTAPRGGIFGQRFTEGLYNAMTPEAQRPQYDQSTGARRGYFTPSANTAPGPIRGTIGKFTGAVTDAVKSFPGAARGAATDVGGAATGAAMPERGKDALGFNGRDSVQNARDRLAAAGIEY